MSETAETNGPYRYGRLEFPTKAAMYAYFDERAADAKALRDELAAHGVKTMAVASALQLTRPEAQALLVRLADLEAKAALVDEMRTLAQRHHLPGLFADVLFDVGADDPTDDGAPT